MGYYGWIRRVQQKDLIKAAKAEVEARRAPEEANLAARRDRKKQEKEEAAEGRRRPSTEKVKSSKDTTPKGDEKKAKEAEADKNNKKPKDAEAAVKAKLKGTKEERERLEAQMLRAQRMREEQEKQRRDKIKGAEISEEQRQIQQAIDEACGAVRGPGGRPAGDRAKGPGAERRHSRRRRHPSSCGDARGRRKGRAGRGRRHLADAHRAFGRGQSHRHPKRGRRSVCMCCVRGKVIIERWVRAMYIATYTPLAACNKDNQGGQRGGRHLRLPLCSVHTVH